MMPQAVAFFSTSLSVKTSPLLRNMWSMRWRFSSALTPLRGACAAHENAGWAARGGRDTARWLSYHISL
jgi:hypothetical protein